MSNKPKVAFYWCASCGGCEETVVDLNENILQVVAAVDIVLWPVALDFKRKDIEAMADGEIAVSFINGAVRLSEQEEWVELLRQKSNLVVAFGSCAHLGGIPGLGNVADRELIFRRKYTAVPTVDNPDQTFPSMAVTVDGYDLELPSFYDTVKTLDQTIDVDYYLPGCPPPSNLVWDAVMAILEGKLLRKELCWLRTRRCAIPARATRQSRRNSPSKSSNVWRPARLIQRSVFLRRATSAWGRRPAPAAVSAVSMGTCRAGAALAPQMG